ncbi:CHAT domain-containing protein [Actinomadura sp. KC216]|uniref:CHAT domain-containing protein n=1 Tax=Actinomadura sp. KC216 TaxID=2530370 RepID=UPI00104B4D37|nr:CHAT domain-containing protein [Actinomadura sp. KC216]TDB88013.1 CHAT domain-containing protein [Actinomadura sp. KC216]
MATHGCADLGTRVSRLRRWWSGTAAGYPQVIGILWAVNDTAATTIAKLVYTELTRGHPDLRRAPAALRNALTRMRQEHPQQASLWTSHIHIGI